MTLPIRALAPRFDPRRIAIPSQWIDFSDASTLYDTSTGGSLVAADGFVGRAEDKSGNSWHVTQSSVGNARPVRRVAAIGGLDALQFDGGDALFSSTFTVAQPLAMFVVARPSSGVPATRALIDGTPNRVSILRNATPAVLCRDAAASDTTLTETWADDVTLVITWILNGSSGVIRVNATQKATDNVINAGGCTSPIIGAATTGGNFGFIGYICEFILYPIAPTSAQAEYVERGLMAKWRV